LVQGHFETAAVRQDLRLDTFKISCNSCAPPTSKIVVGFAGCSGRLGGEFEVSEETVQRVKRFFKIIGGFTLLLVGVLLIFTPAPGWVVIALGLGLLGAEFVWARRLLDRLKAGGGRLRNAMLRQTTPKT